MVYLQLRQCHEALQSLDDLLSDYMSDAVQKRGLGADFLDKISDILIDNKNSSVILELEMKCQLCDKSIDRALYFGIVEEWILSPCKIIYDYIKNEVENNIVILEYDSLNEPQRAILGIYIYIEELKETVEESFNLNKESENSNLLSCLDNVQILSLWQSLKGNYINAEIELEDFKKIFSKNAMNCKPIHWIRSNRLLAYLLNQMFTIGLIQKMEWKSIIEKYQLIKNRNSKFINAQDISSALSEINEEGLQPRGFDKIDEILKIIKNLNKV